MIRLEKAGREDLAALVQLQEMVRARLLPEGQPLPETAGDTLEEFFDHGVVLRALMEDDTMVGAVGGREVDGRQHLSRPYFDRFTGGACESEERLRKLFD